MNSRRFRIPMALAGLLSASMAMAQQNDIPLDRDIYYGIDRNGAHLSSTMHTAMRPIIQSRAELHNVMGYRPDSSREYYWITQKLFKEHLVQVHEGDFHLTGDILFRFGAGKEFREGSDYSGSNAMTHNGRGFRIAADLGPTVSFQTEFHENQAMLTGYMYRYSQLSGVVPGQGRIKNFHRRGLDFAWAAGNVSWTPRPWINVQLGQGRHFIGNGYRSMLLSDNASPYPFVKFSLLSRDKRFQYTVIQAKLHLVGLDDRLPTGEASESLFWWKRASFMCLSGTFGAVQLGLFEGTLWKTIGASGVLPFNAMEINPLIGLNTAVNGFEGRNTELLGMDAKWKLTDQAFLYGQFALTDPGEGRYAWQAGLQWFDLFCRDLHLLLEYDHATPYAYARPAARMGWTHFGQPLASPLGTDFSEAVALVDCKLGKRLWAEGEFSLARYRPDLRFSNLGTSDILGEELSDGVLLPRRQRLYTGLNLSWRMNQMTNMAITLGWTTRDLQPAPTDRTSGMLYLAWHTGLFNRYHDL